MSPAWDNITAIDANNVAASLAFLPHIPDNYSCALRLIMLHSLQVGRLQFDAPFLFVFFRFKLCISFTENISLRVQYCTRNFIQFSIACKNYHFCRYATVANLLCSNIDICTKPSISWKQIFTSVAGFIFVTF